jgi:hypothetical protein
MENAASNLARFLLRETGTVLGRWEGTMGEADQVALFGRYLDEQIIIDGERELIRGGGQSLTWRQAELKG